MKYALSFAFLAILICYLAASQGGWWYLLIWFAISFFALAVGYASVGARIFSKQPDGTIPFWVKIIHFPFFVYTGVVWHVTRILSRENPFDKVEDDLILGRRLLAGELPEGIVNCVDLTAEFEESKEIRESTNYISLPILEAAVPTSEELANAFSQLKEGATYVSTAAMVPSFGSICKVPTTCGTRSRRSPTRSKKSQPVPQASFSSLFYIIYLIGRHRAGAMCKCRVLAI